MGRSTRTARCDAASRPPAGAPRHPIQPNATRIIDLRADEDALWGDLRKKWRQYVNKARTGGIVVVDAGEERLGEFYRIYRETADRAGFLIRAESAYRDVWGAFAPTGNARLLFAQTADGDPQATLFLVRCGPRVVEPYGGMTAAGADSRANYLLKWEAIRSSREAGATSYDLWGLATGGIAHFKTGFGGREVRYIGAWDLVLSPLGRAGLRAGAADAVSAGPAGAAGSPTGGARRPTEGPIERSRRGRRRAGRLGRGHGRCARRPCPPVAGVGRASPRERLAAALPRRRRRRSGAGARPVVAGRARRQRLPAARTRSDRRRAGGPRRAADRVRGRAGATTGSTSSPPTPRCRTPTPASARRSRASGFRPIEEIQPSRHRISLALDGRTRGGGVRGRLQVDPPADPEGRGDGRARRPPRRARRARRAR